MINILDTDLCTSEAGYRIFGLLGYIIEFIQIAVPILIILLGTIDLVKAVIAQSDDQVKKAQSSLVKRVIYGVVIFFIPMLVNFVVGLANGTGADSKNVCLTSFSNPKEAMKMADEVKEAVNKYVDIQNNVSSEDCEAKGGELVGEETAKLYGTNCVVNRININDQIKTR